MIDQPLRGDQKQRAPKPRQHVVAFPSRNLLSGPKENSVLLGKMVV